MKRFIAALLLAAYPIPPIRYFQFTRKVQAPPSTTGQTCFVLDEQTFAHASPDLADLRLFRGGDTVPYVIRGATVRPALRQTIPVINLGRRDGKTVFDAEMPDGSYNDVELSLAGRDFLAAVVVSGSQKVDKAPTRIGSYTIFDFTSQKLGRSTILHLPRSDYRTLHFVIAGPVKPEQIQNLAATPQPISQMRYITLNEAAQFSQKGRSSVAELTIPANVPVDRIVFDAPADPVNFSRAVTIDVTDLAPGAADSARSERPMTVAFGEILRIHRNYEGRRVDEERLTINPPDEMRNEATKWTVTVANGDDAPIRFAGIRLQMMERNLCYEAAEGAIYSLYYGDSTLLSPHYDYASWFAQASNPVIAGLGPQQLNPGYQPRPDSRPFSERHPALLWVALIAVILLLGVITLRSARRMRPPTQMP